MPINPGAVGSRSEPVTRSWKSRDALLYALGVGAGYPDPAHELAFTTENSRDVAQQVLPTFVVTLGAGRAGDIGTFNPAMLVHGEQGIELHRPLTPDGSIVATSSIVEVADKGSGALIRSVTEAVDADTGEPVFSTTSGIFIRGEGGFESAGQPAEVGLSIPERDPDHVVTYPTLVHQALMYRLSGDRNPLHSDPWFAGKAGFSRPILHGLCTYGVTGRALLHTLCGSDPARLTSMYGRFSKPVTPGDDLTVSIWLDEAEGAASFRTSANGVTVVDRGWCTFA